MVSSISGSFVNIGMEKIDEAINQALQQAGIFFNLDRSVIYQFSAAGGTIDNTHGWHAEGIEPLADFFKKLSREAVPWLLPQVRAMSPLYISDVSKLPPEAGVEKKGFLRQGLKSLLILPFSLENGGNTGGFLGFDSIKGKKAWTGEQISLLKIVAEAIAAALSRQGLEMQRARTEKTLKESETRYRTIVENTNDALFTHTFEGNILDLNETAYRMLGYQQNELIGKNLNLIRSAEEQRKAPLRIRQLLKDNKLLFEGTLGH